MTTSRSDLPAPDPVVGWRPDIHPPILTIHPAQARDFIVQITGMHSGIRVEPSFGQLAVAADSRGRHLHCPTCRTGAGLAHQEWVYASRPILDSALHRVDDPDRSTPLWFVTLAADAEPDGAFDLTGALAAPFYCRFCAHGYTLPPDVHAALPWVLT
ncbi:hypothetical protein [Frankia gtarii]|uniref:hypothetical protein n=1 Tax=Frankia gtarii TaxID=2950102 RepID=UPI0021C05B5D|nr:hypothetical protein [Frankia gtarii]